MINFLNVKDLIKKLVLLMIWWFHCLFDVFLAAPEKNTSKQQIFKAKFKQSSPGAKSVGNLPIWRHWSENSVQTPLPANDSQLMSLTDTPIYCFHMLSFCSAADFVLKYLPSYQRPFDRIPNRKKENHKTQFLRNSQKWKQATLFIQYFLYSL